MRNTIIIAAATLTGLAMPAAAQDAYVGLGYDYSTPHSGEDQDSVTGLLGVTFGSGPIGYGVEADFGQAIDDKAGSVDAMRLRAVGSYDFGKVTALVSAGGTQYDIDGATYDGYNYGVGGQMDVGAASAVRLEVIRDVMDDDKISDTTNTRLAYIYKF